MLVALIISALYFLYKSYLEGEFCKSAEQNFFILPGHILITYSLQSKQFKYRKFLIGLILASWSIYSVELNIYRGTPSSYHEEYLFFLIH